MPRFRIPVEHLPPPDANGNHLFRFRMLSEDRNRRSEYSNLFMIESKGQIYPLQATPEIVSSGSVTTVYWETPSIYNTGASAIGASVLHNHESEWRIHPSDVFISWDGGSYEYFGRSSDSTIGIIKRPGSSTLKVRVQVANYPPTISNKFLIFETDIISV